MTTSQTVAEEISALLRARNPLIWVVTKEEARAERYIFEAAQRAKYVPYTWDTGSGLCNVAGTAEGRWEGDIDAALNGIREAINQIQEEYQTYLRRGGDASKFRDDRRVYILRDVPVWLRDLLGASPCRRMRNLARFLPGVERKFAVSMVVITPSTDIPPELQGHATLIEWPIPDREEIAGILDATLSALPEKIRKTALADGDRDAAIEAAIGLSGEESQSCYARSLVQTRTIDPKMVAAEKKRLIARERLLEWIDPLPGGLSDVGGLDVLKGFLLTRRLAYSPEARAYGLPAPRGVLIVGVSGCGKSLTAKATATAFGGVPLLRMDLGALKSKYVGESEANLRNAFRIIAAVGRCVVWLDEIEKGLQGATSGSADGGVSADALGAILVWMQERQGDAFVIATSNDVSQLPPEFLRKGRFDDMFFVDLPNDTERREVIKAALREYKRTVDGIDVDALAEATSGFTGAEIAALVPEALFAAFADGARPITTDDLTLAASHVAPLSKTAGEKIKRLREWSNGRCRLATSRGGDSEVVVAAERQTKVKSPKWRVPA